MWVFTNSMTLKIIGNAFFFIYTDMYKFSNGP